MNILNIPIPEKVSSNKAYSGFAHWSVRNKLKDLYHQIVFLEIKKNPIKEKISFPCTVVYEFQWKSRLLDTTNQFFMIKLIEDGLVHAGIFPDDTPEYVYETRSRSVRGKEDMLVVSII